MTISTEELARLIEAATPGPWMADHHRSWSSALQKYETDAGCYNEIGPLGIGVTYADDVWIEASDADAVLITLTPDLASEVIRLRAQVAAGEKLAEAGKHLAATADHKLATVKEVANGVTVFRAALAEWDAGQ